MNSTNLDSFVLTLQRHAHTFGVTLNPATEESLCQYYELLTRWNERLHLIAPCSPEEFAVRHILESLCALAHLPDSARFADVGSGAGLPAIPCLIVRPDLSATLIESSQKKSVFLREALNRLQLSTRATTIAKPFEEVAAPAVDFVTCRALDQFLPKLEALLKWAPRQSTLLLFGGESLRAELRRLGANFNEFLIPASERRFLFVAAKPIKR